jgi:hypothetical protein
MSAFGEALVGSTCYAMNTILGNEHNFYASSSSLPFDLNDMVWR